jgi:hypothetical protein
MAVAALVWALATLAAGPVHAAERPLLLLDLPEEGPLSATAKAAYAALHGTYDISWPQAQAGPKRDGEPAATICISDSPSAANRKLDEVVRRGRGLVIVVSERRIGKSADFLKAFGVGLVPLPKAVQQVSLLPHSATREVGNLAVSPMRYGLTAEGLEPIATNDGATMALAGMIGSGRIVLLPEGMLTVADPSQAPNAPQTRLLTQAIIWTSFSGTVAPGTGAGPGEAATGRPAAAGLAQKALVDIPDDPAWSVIAGLIRDELTKLGLPSEAVGYVKGQRSLVAPLQDCPALVVLASHRGFEDTETAAISGYVSAGGSLLVLGSGDKKDTDQVMALNRMLGEFGVGYVLGRPRGQVVLRPHPITQGLTAPGEIGPGGAVWAFAQWPLAMVGDAAVAGAVEFRQGRIVVCDASTLLPPAEKQPGAPVFFTSLLVAALGWLTGK